VGKHELRSAPPPPNGLPSLAATPLYGSSPRKVRWLEARLAPREPAIAINRWCRPDGQPCDPPTEVVVTVEQQALGRWRCAVWVPESGCVVLLREGGELQIVEL